jgi:hypothetical protein
MNMHGDPKRYRVLVLVRVTRLNGYRDVLRPGVICATALPAADRVTFEGRGNYIDLVAGELERLIGSRKIEHLLGWRRNVRVRDPDSGPIPGRHPHDRDKHRLNALIVHGL